MINHALVLLDPMTVPCASQATSQPPQWLQISQVVGAMATAIGVLTALYIAVVRDPRSAYREHLHHVERMNALQGIKRERAAAQARRVVPSCRRLPMFGDSWWAVRIDNAGNALTTILKVDVTALDANGFEIPGGCRQANDAIPFDRAFHRAVGAAQSESSGEREPALKQVVRDALAGHVVQQWPRSLPPNQYVAMPYATTDPKYTLRVTIEYEDEAGYQWLRTDGGPPRRTDQEPRGLPTLERSDPVTSQPNW